MLYDLMAEVRDLLNSTVTVDRVGITLGEPPHSDDCSAIHIWAARIFDSPSGVLTRTDEAGCLYRRAYEIRYRYDQCYDSVTDEGGEPAVAVLQADAEPFYDNADLIWCALAEAASAGTLFTGADCEDIVIQALGFDPPQGDRASAEGAILVTWPCSEAGS